MMKTILKLALLNLFYLSMAQAAPVKYIQSTSSLQSGTTFYVSSGTVSNLSIRGKTNGVASPVGDVGEEMTSSIVRSAAINNVTGSAVSVSTVTLTAGVWEVRGACGFLPTAGTSITLYQCNISKTANAEPSADTIAVPNSSGEIKYPQAFAAFIPGGNDFTIPIPPAKVVITSPTAYYITSVSIFTVNTMKSYGHIYARRVQ